MPAGCADRSDRIGNSANTRSRFFDLAAARAWEHCPDVEVLRDRKRWKHLSAFGHLADAEIANPVTFPAGNVGAVKLDAAARRPVHARNRANKRALARSVRPDDGDDRARRDV